MRLKFACTRVEYILAVLLVSETVPTAATIHDANEAKGHLGWPFVFLRPNIFAAMRDYCEGSHRLLPKGTTVRLPCI